MRNERDVDVLFALADIAISENRIDEAKALLDEILMIDPHYGRAYNHLGWFYVAKVENTARAEELFNLALKYSPDYPAVYINLGRLYFQLRRYAEAIEILNRALAVPGADFAAVYDVLSGVYERKGDYREAYRCLKKAHADATNTPYLAYIKGEMKRVRSRLNPLEIFSVFL
jgi:tetratricopeptide (TPR) repeat protein